MPSKHYFSWRTPRPENLRALQEACADLSDRHICAAVRLEAHECELENAAKMDREKFKHLGLLTHGIYLAWQAAAADSAKALARLESARGHKAGHADG